MWSSGQMTDDLTHVSKVATAPFRCNICQGKFIPYDNGGTFNQTCSTCPWCDQGFNLGVVLITFFKKLSFEWCHITYTRYLPHYRVAGHVSCASPFILLNCQSSCANNQDDVIV